MDSRLLDRLAAEAAAGPPPSADVAAAVRRMAIGFAAAATLALGWLGLRQDIAVASATPFFWVKLTFPVTLALLAGWAVWRSAHPGRSAREPLVGLAAVVLLFWIVTLMRPLAGVSDIDWEVDLWGRTWRECALYIALMALPMWLPAMAWIRRWGPVRPRLAGSLVGLCCGTLSAALYALHCRESGMAFLGLWYLAGASVPAVLGAILGRRWLGW